MATAVYSSMAPAAQDPLQVLLCKAAYYAQVAAEALGAPFSPGMYPNMTPFAQDPLQVLAAKLAYWTSQIAAGGGGGGAGGLIFTSGVGDPAIDGSIATQGYLDTSLSPPAKYINVAWPVTAAPVWEAI
jgi:hypothetical protein